MLSPLRLFLVGLGNPGREFTKTRHNIGWMFLDYFIETMKIKTRPEKRERYTIISHPPYYLVRPTSFMNHSGIAVKACICDYQIENLEEIVVIVDDINLPLGRTRLRFKGSSGGHKGLESIISHLGSSNFPRLRIGIDKDSLADYTDYVLAPFNKKELAELKSVFARVIEGVELILKEGYSYASNVLNPKPRR